MYFPHFSGPTADAVLVHAADGAQGLILHPVLVGFELEQGGGIAPEDSASIMWARMAAAISRWALGSWRSNAACSRKPRFADLLVFHGIENAFLPFEELCGTVGRARGTGSERQSSQRQ